MQCLYYYSINEFNHEIESKLKIQNWLIYAGNPKNKINKIKDTECYQILKSKADKKYFINAKPLEILSWIDTMSLLYHTLLNVNQHITQELTIIQEYKIPLSNKRADYLLLYRNKIIIVEYSFDKLGNEYNYETKLTQAIGYKELLSNILPPNIKIGTYTFIINPEIDENNKEKQKYNRYSQEYELANNEKIKEFASYIDLFFTQTEDTALQTLNQLENKINEIDESKIEYEPLF